METVHLAIPRVNHATLGSRAFADSATSAWNVTWHPYVTVSVHFEIVPQDRDVPAVIRVTSTVSVTAVHCTRSQFIEDTVELSYCPGFTPCSSCA